MDRIGLPETIDDVANLLSNDDDPDYPIYRQETEKDDGITLATGIFDLKQNYRRNGRFMLIELKRVNQ